MSDASNWYSWQNTYDNGDYSQLTDLDPNAFANQLYRDMTKYDISIPDVVHENPYGMPPEIANNSSSWLTSFLDSLNTVSATLATRGSQTLDFGKNFVEDAFTDLGGVVDNTVGAIGNVGRGVRDTVGALHDDAKAVAGFAASIVPLLVIGGFIVMGLYVMNQKPIVLPKNVKIGI